MDVVGTVASAISILEASGKTVHALARFYSDFANANTTLGRFTEVMKQEQKSLEGLRDLCVVHKQEAPLRSMECLEDVDQLFQSRPDEHHTLYTDVVEAVKSLESAAKKSSSSSKNRNTKQKRMTFGQKLRWSLTGKRKIESLISRLDRHQHRVNNALIKLQSYMSMDIMKEIQQVPTRTDLKTTETVMLMAIRENNNNHAQSTSIHNRNEPIPTESQRDENPTHRGPDQVVTTLRSRGNATCPAQGRIQRNDQVPFADRMSVIQYVVVWWPKYEITITDEIDSINTPQLRFSADPDDSKFLALSVSRQAGIVAISGTIQVRLPRGANTTNFFF